jgi:hypothetical protein
MPGAYDSGYARAGPVLGTVQALAVPGTRARRGGGDGHGPRQERMLRWQKGTRTHASSTVAVLIMAQDAYAVRPPTAPPPRCGRGMAAVSLARPRSVATRSRQPPPQPPLNSMRARARACQCDATQGFPSIGPCRPSPSIQIPSKTKRTRAFPRPSPFHQVSP